MAVYPFGSLVHNPQLLTKYMAWQSILLGDSYRAFGGYIYLPASPLRVLDGQIYPHHFRFPFPLPLPLPLPLTGGGGLGTPAQALPVGKVEYPTC